jgi:hypothetical protein
MSPRSAASTSPVAAVLWIVTGRGYARRRHDDEVPASQELADEARLLAEAFEPSSATESVAAAGR